MKQGRFVYERNNCPRMNSNKKAYLFAGLAVFFWSTVATAFKIALREFDFIQLIFYVSGVTVVLLFFVLLFQKKLHLVFSTNRRQWIYSLLMGHLIPCFITWFYLKLIPFACSGGTTFKYDLANYTWHCFRFRC